METVEWVKPCIKCGAQDRFASGACKRCAKLTRRARTVPKRMLVSATLEKP